jgi:hypothetical protein
MGEYPKLSIGPGCVANAIMLGAQYREFLPVPIGVAIAAIPAILFIMVRVESASDETVTVAHGLAALLFIVVFLLSIAGYIATVDSTQLTFLVPLGMLGFVPSCYVLWKISKGDYIESPDKAL